MIVFIVVIFCIHYFIKIPITSNTIFDAYWEKFNGALMPILTAINIFVFIRLTNKIDNNNSLNHQREIDLQLKIDESNNLKHKKEIELQERIDQNNTIKFNKDIEIQIKTLFFNNRIKMIRDLNESLINLRSHLDKKEFSNSLEDINKYIINHIVTSRFFRNDDNSEFINIEDPVLININYLIVNFNEIDENTFNDKKVQLFKDTFVLIEKLEFFSVGQLIRDNSDGAVLSSIKFIKDIKQKN